MSLVHFGVDAAGVPVSRGLALFLRSLHLIGQSGCGKSTLLSSLIWSLHHTAGILLIDPDGNLAEDVLRHISSKRAEDVLYWDPAKQSARPWGANLWREDDPDKQTLNAEWFKEALRLANPGADWGLNVETAAGAVVEAMAPAGATIADIPRFLRDRAYRRTFYEDLGSRNPQALEFLTRYDEAGSVAGKKMTAEQEKMVGPLLRRVEKLLVNATLRRILAQEGTAFDLRELMAKRRILVVRLNESDLGPGARQVLSNLLIGQLFRYAKNRSPKDPPFIVIVDEAASIAHAGWSGLIAEARKYNVGLVLAHQNLSGLEEAVKSMLLVIPNRVCFQVAGPDVRHLAGSFPDPEEIGRTLRGLPRYQAVARLDNDLDNGSTVTELNVAPLGTERHDLLEEIVRRSDALGTPKEQVDQEVLARERRRFAIKETVEELPPSATGGVWDE